MLAFKEKPFEPEMAPRWAIGVDRRHVAVYVAVALISGFAIGFMVARTLGRKESPSVPPMDAGVNAPLPPARPAAIETAPTDFHRVNRILRADTLEVEGVGPVRMIGVETPDGKSPKEIYGKYGQNALSFVEKAALNQDVRLDFDAANAARSNKDESGQTLAYVYTRDGTMLNSELLREGLAFVRSLDEFKMSNDFRTLERDAMQTLRGVWGPSPGSSASTTATASSPSSGEKAADRPSKVAPLPPSAFGPNIPAISGSSSVSPSEPMVFVSPADHLYHKAGCEMLDSKKQTLALTQARAHGYRPCSRCYPSTSMRAP